MLKISCVLWLCACTHSACVREYVWGLGRKEEIRLRQRLGCRVVLFLAFFACTTGNPLNTRKSFLYRTHGLQPAALTSPPQQQKLVRNMWQILECVLMCVEGLVHMNSSPKLFVFWCKSKIIVEELCVPGTIWCLSWLLLNISVASATNVLHCIEDWTGLRDEDMSYF